jgi:hypothetical protein
MAQLKTSPSMKSKSILDASLTQVLGVASEQIVRPRSTTVTATLDHTRSPPSNSEEHSLFFAALEATSEFRFIPMALAVSPRRLSSFSSFRLDLL